MRLLSGIKNNIYSFSTINDIPLGIWRWRNFRPEEIRCKGNGSIVINEDALDKLQYLRDLAGREIIILSAYRSYKHNLRVGGAPNSLHKKGAAFDISSTNISPWIIESLAKKVGFTGFGFYDNFIHIDTGIIREWDSRVNI